MQGVVQHIAKQGNPCAIEGCAGRITAAPVQGVLQHIAEISTAPDGIARIRALVLELAMRGRLTKTEKSDEPVSSLCERMQLARVELVQSGKVKRFRATTPVKPAEHPHRLPPTWRWVRLSDVGHDWGQQEPSKAFTYIDVGAIDNKAGVIRSPQVVQARDASSRARKKVREGSVIYSTIRPYLLNVAVVPGGLDPEPIVSTAFAVVHPICGMPARFLFWWLRSPPFIRYVESVQTGIAYPAINDAQFFNGLVPLPPLLEQERIVATIDELMALCDLLEARQQKAEATHGRLVEALLDSLAQARDVEAFQAHWQRLSGQFESVFTTTSSVDDLKNQILQLGVAGLLVRPKTRQVALFQPFNRRVMSLGEVAEQIVDCPHSTPKWTKTGEICVRTNQFKRGTLDLSDCRYVSRETYVERTARLEPREGDVLYSREGGILGVACRVPPGVRLCLGQRMMLIRPGPLVESAYLELVLNSPQITQLAKEQTTGGAAPRINVSTVRAFPIPVVSLEEQRRTVTKANELLALCDRLKARIASARAKHAQLAEALVEQALAG